MFNKKYRDAGLSLVEVLVALGVGSLVLVATTALSLYSSKSFATMLNQAELNNQSHETLDRITQRIRVAQKVKDLKTDQLILVDSSGADLKLKYDDKKKTLTMTDKAKDKNVLTGCDAVKFSMFQGTPIGSSFDLVTTTNEADCKVVQIQWNCSRSLLGSRTETMQSARVVIRNK